MLCKLSLMLSILIPTYNHNVYKLVLLLHKQAEVLGIPYEISVLDDHSSLRIPENDKIKELSNVHYQILDKNIGRAAARGLLAKQARFERLLFLDADVQPVTDVFLSKYIKEYESTKADVIYGGVAYEEKLPNLQERLRWYYGRSREVKSVAERMQTPYFVSSPNLLISKDLFQKINTLLENIYGDDLIISQQLKNEKVTVHHIDNAVYHLGLETSKEYLSKALSAIKTIIALEKRGEIDHDLTKLQQSYLQLRKWKATGLFRSIIGLFKNPMKKNLISAAPNLFYFDLYKLLYYIELKNKKSD